jgi:hypothetical protein
MKRTAMAICAVLVFGLMAVEMKAVAQQSGSAADGQSPQYVLLASTPVTDKPFTAAKYVRTVKTLADGSHTVVAESKNVRVARETDGRVSVRIHRFEEKPQWELDQTVVLNPTEKNIHFWMDGKMYAKVSAILPLTEAQINGLNSPPILPESASQAGFEPPSVTTKNLGSQVIQGVPVTGVRTVTTYPAGYSGNDLPVKITREVWSSEEMKLVMKVVTTDPRIGETTSGYEHFSRHPDAELFRPPDGYEVQHNRQRAGGSIDDYLIHLAKGEVW